jgi:hypothetical protein
MTEVGIRDTVGVKTDTTEHNNTVPADTFYKIRQSRILRYPANGVGKEIRHFPTSPSLKGQSHEKVGELRAWGLSLGPN